MSFSRSRFDHINSLFFHDAEIQSQQSFRVQQVQTPGGQWRCLQGLRQGEEHQRLQGERQEEEEEEGLVGPKQTGRGRRWDGPLPLGPVAERGVAAGDADGVQPAGAELLVARGGDEASAG